MPDNIARPFTAASFNQYLAEHRLMGTRCPMCDAVYLPPRDLPAVPRRDA